MNSLEKWRLMEEDKTHEERQRVIAQNGNSAKHYKEAGTQLKFSFWEEQEPLNKDNE